MATARDFHLAVEDLADRTGSPGLDARALRGRTSRWALPRAEAPRLLEVIVGMRRPARGRVLVDDLDHSELDLEQLAAWRLGCVAWLGSAPPSRAEPARFVEAPLVHRGFTRRQRIERIRPALRAWQHQLGRPGERHAAMNLARATAQQPDLVIAPAGRQRETRALLRTLRDLGASRPTLVMWREE